jgi:hypothetical protein
MFGMKKLKMNQSPSKLGALSKISISSQHIPPYPWHAPINCFIKRRRDFISCACAQHPHRERAGISCRNKAIPSCIGCSQCCFWCSAHTHTHRGTIKHIYTEDASNAHTHLEITLFFWPCERASARQVGSGAFEVARPPPLALPAAADIGSSGCSD